ncbi:hypothetical protein Tco_0800341 [Tanacetum coccineum]|uniref:Uncharacterized protein n=1 Tax=Tanacetum coccineum TaxID=301880 RepID=A0ABQ4ZSS9_9ASTR
MGSLAVVLLCADSNSHDFKCKVSQAKSADTILQSTIIMNSAGTQENQCRHVQRGRDTKIPQSNGPLVKVGDEAIHKELGDRMERAATTASSLEAEQASGNIK